MAPKLGLEIAEIALEEAQFRSHLAQVKSFANDLKLLTHSDCAQNISKINVLIRFIEMFITNYRERRSFPGNGLLYYIIYNYI